MVPVGCHFSMTSLRSARFHAGAAAMMLALAASAHAASPALEIAHVVTTAGSQVSIDVKLSNAAAVPGIRTLDFTLALPWQPSKINRGDVAGSTSVTTTGTVALARFFYADAGKPLAAGPLASVTIEVPKEARLGPYPLAFSRVAAKDSLQRPVRVTSSDGSLTVTGTLPPIAYPAKPQPGQQGEAGQ